MKNPSVDDLRAVLVRSGKYTQEQADAIKGKTKLTEAVLALENTEENQISSFFDDVEVESVVNTPKQKESEQKVIPSKLAPEWQDYVLSQFVSSELEDGKYPNLVGLRRVSQILLGEIVDSLPTQLNTIVDERNKTGYSVCVYKVVFDNGFGIKSFSAAASASANNTDDEYSVFPEAIAESRAEARAIRKALNLKIVSKDELTSKNIKEVISSLNTREIERSGAWLEDDGISTSQKLMIGKTADRLGIDLQKLLEKEKLTSIDVLSKKEAANLIELLNKYQSSGKESIEIPVEIKKVS